MILATRLTQKKSLAYSLGLRIKRICESEADYKKHRSDLKLHLRKRGYSGREIERQLQKIDKMDREELLHKESKRQRNDRVPLVITYSKSLPDIRGILRKHQDTLYMSERMQKVFAKPPLLAFRRDKNICDTTGPWQDKSRAKNGRKTLYLWVLQQIGEEWNPRHYRC